MAARQNVIVVVSTGSMQLRNAFSGVQDLAIEWIGPLRVLSIQDLLTGASTDQRVEGVVTPEILPEVSENELIALYSDDPANGAVLMVNEHPYATVILAAGKHGLAVDRLKKVWQAVGKEVQCVLVGEELDVDASSIAELLRNKAIPSRLDLCEAAIIHGSSRFSRESSELPYDGLVLLRE